MKKQYSNFAEQVNDNVKDLELFNELLENNELWFEPLFELLLKNVESNKIINEYSLPKTTTVDDAEYQDALYEYINGVIDQVYQIYKVDIKGSYNEEHKRLNIFFNNELDSYILPVYHYGTDWEYVPTLS